MKIPTIFKLLLCLAAGCSLTACATAQQTATKAAAPAYSEQVSAFYPLAVGYKWTYQGTMLGVATEKTLQITGFADGFYRDNSGGNLKIDNYGLRDKEGRYLLRGPLAKGSNWMSVPNVSTVERYEIIAEGHDITTAAGTFTGCIVVKSTSKLPSGDILVNNTTFAPRVGIVRLQTFLQTKKDNIPQIDLKLVKYNTH